MTTIYNTEIGSDIDAAKRFLDNHEIVAIPTETVYGLAANAFKIEAIEKIFIAKKRPFNNPLIVHIGDLETLRELVKDIPLKAQMLIDHFFPGPLTILLPKKDIIPDIVTAGLSHIAVRMPSHPLARKLLQKLNYPLAAPSANVFGSISPINPTHVLKQLGGKIPYILDGGDCELGIESTIIGFEGTTPVIYRSGSIAKDRLENIIGPVTVHKSKTTVLVAPGMLNHHYSPATPLYLTDDIAETMSRYSQAEVGLITFSEYSKVLPIKQQIVLSFSANIDEAAHHLYAAMYTMDESKYKVIMVQRMPDRGVGQAINDRLHRASINKA